MSRTGIDNGMRHRCAVKERGDDLYETPSVATEALAAAARLPRVIWEPACGRGAIAGVLAARGHHVISTDLVDYGYEGAEARRDFLFEESAPLGVEAIVTNPPYKIADAFVAHAIRLCPKVFMLLRLAFLESGVKSADRRFALDGGRLKRVMVFANRLPAMNRDGYEGKKCSNGKAYAWFCWDADHCGEPRIKRLWWGKHEGRQQRASAESEAA